MYIYTNGIRKRRMNDNTRWTRSKESNRTTNSSNGNRSPVENNNKNKKGMRRPLTRPHETEEEAIIRRFHDAQRMAKFRAKKRKALEEARVMEASKLSEEIAMITELRRRNVIFEITPVTQPQNTPSRINETVKKENSLATITPVMINSNNHGPSKYNQLLSVIEELGRDVKLTYAGSKTSAERIKSGIAQARMLVRDCLLETEINSRQ